MGAPKQCTQGVGRGELPNIQGKAQGLHLFWSRLSPADGFLGPFPYLNFQRIFISSLALEGWHSHMLLWTHRTGLSSHTPGFSDS